MNIKIFIITIFLSGLFLSCNDWLDVRPTTELDRKDLFTSETGYADALAGIYAGLTSTELYGRTLTWHMLDLFAGYYKTENMTGNNLMLGDYPFKHKNSNRNDNIIADINNIWSKTYSQLAALNSIIETIDDNNSIFKADNYRIMKGEALGLRAFLHFDLLRMFGQPYALGKDSLCIPYVTQLSTKVTKLATVDSTLTLIINDLLLARDLMQNDPIATGETPSAVLASLPSGNYTTFVSDWHNRRFHFNYYAVTATLARAYLWKGDKINALLYAKELIDNQDKKFPWVATSNLTTIETTDKNQDRTFATEQIFALNIRKTSMNSNMDGYFYFEKTSAMDNLLNADYTLYEGYTSDPRYQYNITKSQNFYLLSKFYQKDGVYTFFQERLPLIRITEMYYIAAECETDISKAVGYINTVRNQRGLTASPVSTNITVSELSNEIQKEYQKELFGEGQLWFYFKRNMISSIPNMNKFNDLSLYTFDRPEEEDLYGGR